LPFGVRFGDGDTAFDQLNIDSNGALSFTNFSTLGYTNQPFPVENINSVIAPLWDDLKPGPYDGNIYYDTVGKAPNREFVVEWRDVNHIASASSATFQVVFFENSSDILFNYLDVDFGVPEINNGANATIGIQTTRDLNILISHDLPLIESKTALRFSIANLY
jgi:hypothetical protein